MDVVSFFYPGNDYFLVFFIKEKKMDKLLSLNNFVSAENSRK